ncbi:MAG: protoporphyrinogen oxidase [Polyangiaceae bacterium]|nr:protoporphyrinogen oxidase [Polyangiaceae bacterium]
MKRVVIVGGGITGLATAHALEQAPDQVSGQVSGQASAPMSIRLVEASARLGGNIQTITYNGFTIDAGPDSWVANKPHAARLARAVGLGNEIIGTRPESRKVHIVWQRRLHPMPAGLVLGIPTEVAPFLKTDLLTLDAKLRAGLEPLIPRKDWSGDADETIASFVSRRLGDQICARLVGPLLGGISAGDPEELSVRACFPQLVDAEQVQGSLILHMMRSQHARRKEQAARAAASEGKPSIFQSLTRGVGDLIVNVVHKLRTAEVLTGRSVRSIARLEPGNSEGRWAVETDSGTLLADDVVITAAAYAAARMLRGVDRELEDVLTTIRYVSTATVFLAYRNTDVDFPPDSVGFLVPHAEQLPILAGTFVSNKWNHRAPLGQALTRVFFGGSYAEHLLERDDDTLVQIAREQLERLLGITRAPTFTRVFRFHRASPQPAVGHLGRMARLRRRLESLPGLHIGGNGYVGTGISDSIKQGEEIAARITPLSI